jgi:catechol 2,3-dioxygenase-like lactoylglutathione lyase family enzyme
MADRITANLPARDFDATVNFYGRLGFGTAYRDAGWLILKRGDLELEFFLHPGVDKWTSSFSACVRVDDLDHLLAAWRAADLTDDPRAIPRLTGIVHQPPVPRMLAMVDLDGSLLRCLENGVRHGG